MAIASLKELSCVVIVNGLEPAEDMLAQSNEENIPVLVTTESTFKVTGRIFSLINQ